MSMKCGIGMWYCVCYFRKYICEKRIKCFCFFTIITNNFITIFQIKNGLWIILLVRFTFRKCFRISFHLSRNVFSTGSFWLISVLCMSYNLADRLFSDNNIMTYFLILEKVSVFTQIDPFYYNLAFALEHIFNWRDW